MAKCLSIPVGARGFVTESNTRLQSTIRMAEETLYVFLFAETKSTKQRSSETYTLQVYQTSTQYHGFTWPRLKCELVSRLQGARAPAFIVGLVATMMYPPSVSPRLVLVLQRIIRENHKTKIFRNNAQKHPSQIGKLSSTAKPSVCPPYLSNSRRWHALVNKTHLATQLKPRLLRQPVPLLSRGQVTVDPKRSGTDVKFGASSRPCRFRCLLRARAETAQWRNSCLCSSTDSSVPVVKKEVTRFQRAQLAIMSVPTLRSRSTRVRNGELNSWVSQARGCRM